MLQRARPLQMEGVDVVVGLVETHGRAETEALTAGLEMLPRRVVDYQGRRIEEFDLDGALNAAEAHHRRRTRAYERAGKPPSQRWQDIEELLDAGSTSGRRSTSSIWKASPRSSRA